MDFKFSPTVLLIFAALSLLMPTAPVTGILTGNNPYKHASLPNRAKSVWKYIPLSFKVEEIDVTDQCATVQCPEVLHVATCPADSRPRKTVAETLPIVADQDPSEAVLAQERCCANATATAAASTDQRGSCVCRSCADAVPKCEEQMVAVEVRTGNRKPGSCCSQYECVRWRPCDKLAEEEHASQEPASYWQDACVQCRCVGDFALCVNRCQDADDGDDEDYDDGNGNLPEGYSHGRPGKTGAIGCFSGHWNRTMLVGATWKEGDCRECSCPPSGFSDCLGQLCANPECAHPRKIEGVCCRVCDPLDTGIDVPLDIGIDATTTAPTLTTSTSTSAMPAIAAGTTERSLVIGEIGNETNASSTPTSSAGLVAAIVAATTTTLAAAVTETSPDADASASAAPSTASSEAAFPTATDSVAYSSTTTEGAAVTNSDLSTTSEASSTSMGAEQRSTVEAVASSSAPPAADDIESSSSFSTPVSDTSETAESTTTSSSSTTVLGGSESSSSTTATSAGTTSTTTSDSVSASASDTTDFVLFASTDSSVYTDSTTDSASESPVMSSSPVPSSSSFPSSSPVPSSSPPPLPTTSEQNTLRHDKSTENLPSSTTSAPPPLEPQPTSYLQPDASGQLNNLFVVIAVGAAIIILSACLLTSVAVIMKWQGKPYKHKFYLPVSNSDAISQHSTNTSSTV